MKCTNLAGPEFDAALGQDDDEPSLSSIPNSEKKAAAGLKARFGEEDANLLKEAVDSPSIYEK